MFGGMSFAASESFDAVLGSPRGAIFGGGAEVGLPLGRAVRRRRRLALPAGRASACSSRGSEVFPLGIPLDRDDHAARDHRRLAIQEPLPPGRPLRGRRLELVRATRRRRSSPTPARTSTIASPGFTSWAASSSRCRAGWASAARSRGRACPTRSGPAARPRRSTRPNLGRHELPPEDQRWPLSRTLRAARARGRRAHPGRAGHHLRRRRAAGGPARAPPARSATSCVRPASPAFPTTASSPPAGSWAAIRDLA